MQYPTLADREQHLPRGFNFAISFTWRGWGRGKKKKNHPDWAAVCLRDSSNYSWVVPLCDCELRAPGMEMSFGWRVTSDLVPCPSFYIHTYDPCLLLRCPLCKWRRFSACACFPASLNAPQHTQRGRGCCWQSRAKHHTHTHTHAQLYIPSSILHNADRSYIFRVVSIKNNNANHGKCTATMFSNNNLSFWPVFCGKLPLCDVTRSVGTCEKRPNIQMCERFDKENIVLTGSENPVF